MKKFTYSREFNGPEGKEIFTADEFDSFEEAKTAVDRGIRDRQLEIGPIGALKVPHQEESKKDPGIVPAYPGTTLNPTMTNVVTCQTTAKSPQVEILERLADKNN